MGQGIIIQGLEQYSKGNQILKVSELVVPAGQAVCLRGSNGSGKTSLLRMLSGLGPKFSGRVEVTGHDMASLCRREWEQFRADAIGFVFQHYRLVTYLSAYDNILLPCHFSHVRRQGAITRSGTVPKDAFRLIRQMNLKDPSRLSKPISLYSAGQQQRFALARALIGQPKLVLLDEPASAMDSRGRDAIYQLALRECRETGATLICTTHDDQGCEGFDRYLDMDELNQARERTVRW